MYVLGCRRRRNFRGAAISVIVTLIYGAVVGIGGGTTLVDGTVVRISDFSLVGDVVGELVGRYVANISCRVFMVCICSSTTANRYAGAILLRASSKSSTDWRAASVDESFVTGQLCGKKSTVLIILSERVAET